MSQAQDQVPQVAFIQARSRTSPSHGVMDAASPKVLCSCGCGAPCDQGGGRAVMEQGVLSLPGAACGPRQVIPSLFCAFSNAKLKTVS